MASPAHWSKWGPGRNTHIINTHNRPLVVLFIVYNSGFSFVWGINLAFSLERPAHFTMFTVAEQLHVTTSSRLIGWKKIELWIELPAIQHFFVNKSFDTTHRNNIAGAGDKVPQKRPLTEAYAEAIADGVGGSNNQSMLSWIPCIPHLCP